MYIYTKERLAEHPQLHDAITLCELMGLNWRSLYMDPNGELSVCFNGKLSEEQVKTVIMHFKDIIDGDTDVDKINPKVNVDYVICNRHHADNEGEFTQVFTPDGYDYRNV